MSVRLLIVDDTDHVRKMLVEILTFHGFEVVGEADDGEQAVTLSRDVDADVVVMDYKMPGIDGLEATRRIRTDRPDQSVILYSAYVDDLLRDRARQAGVAACIAKPSGVEALATEISALALDIRGEAPATDPASEGGEDRG